MSFLAELWSFLRARKKFWLLPVILVMLLFGGLLVLAAIITNVTFEWRRMRAGVQNDQTA